MSKVTVERAAAKPPITAVVVSFSELEFGILLNLLRRGQYGIWANTMEQEFKANG